MILIVIIVLKVSCSKMFLSPSIKLENFGDNDLTYFFSSGIVVSFLFRSSLKSTKRFVCVFLYPRVLESWTLFSFQIFHPDHLLRTNIAGQNGRGHYWIQAGRASNNSNNVNTIQNIKWWNSFWSAKEQWLLTRKVYMASNSESGHCRCWQNLARHLLISKSCLKTSKYVLDSTLPKGDNVEQLN